MYRLTKVVCLVLCASLALVSVPISGLAAPVDRVTAADPEAVQQALDAMNLEPMPDQLAAELRGESFLYYLYVIGVPLIPKVVQFAANFKGGFTDGAKCAWAYVWGTTAPSYCAP